MDILRERLEREGYLGELLIVHSGGGVMPVKEAAHYAARFAASGLAGGAVAMQEIAKGSGYLNAIGLDVGGTSTDVSLISDGELLVTQNWTIEPGYPIRFPSIEVATVGAGGGSIAWRDDGGSIRNGPLSAGADPGPACYSKGGDAPTNTDARLVLGHLGEDLADAAMQLDVSKARKAIDMRIADPMGWNTERAALAIIQLADNNIVNAVRIITVQKGYDPRDFVLVAFGGSGPLHAVAVAQALSIPTVLIPPHSGITSAFGCSLVNMRHDATRTYLAPVTGRSIAAVKGLLAQMKSEINAQIAREGIEPDKRRFGYFITLRYVGQWRSLEIAFQPDYDLDGVLGAFVEAYESAYSYSEPSGVIEFVGCRVEGTGLLLRPERTTIPGGAGIRPVPSGQRQVLFTGCAGPQSANLYDRTQLLAGQKIVGPAVILEMDSTTLLPPEIPAEVDAFGNLIITLEGEIQ
jgi:N-methylhydantoinase A